MKRQDVKIEDVTPVMQQYLKIKNAHEDLIVFFRLGDFYEMFFDDAELVSHELELTLTGKSCGLKERVPMCGIPYHAASTYIEKLINNGHKIAICEQMEEPKLAKGLVKRDITRIISSGTVMSDNLLNSNDFNFICGIEDFKNFYGVSYCDISTGEIYVFKVEHNISKLISEVLNINPKEIVISSKVDKNVSSILNKQFNLPITVTDEITHKYDYLSDNLDESYKDVIGLLLSYIESNQMKSLDHLQKVIIKDQNKYMKMSTHTKRNLELVETLRQKERTYSLLWLLDKTKTAMGSRLLKSYILSPIIDKNTLEKRYDIVDTLLKEFILKSDLEKYLNDVYDLERLCGKIAFGNANARDLLQLKSSLKVLPNIEEILEKINYKKLNLLENVYDLLEKAIYEDAPITLHDGYLIKEGYNKELDDLKEIRKNGKDFIARFENEERERTGIKNLKVGYNKVFGYYIEVSKGNVPLIKEEYGYQRKQTLVNAERYISPVLKEKEALILNAEEKVTIMEYELFSNIRESIKKYIPDLQEDAKIISEIDVLSSFATVTDENNYVRPTIDENVIDIKEARHPVVEKVINGEFVPNDIYMDESTHILLITGPNMAGKSTFMRQMAIISIMAQIGCFVPATEAKLPIFDAIYTRIGASDDLVSGESTFMVEMTEANKAISEATDRSLLLFDELGRGTATFDGMALAQAIIEYISKNIKAKTFFSTHYHELTDLDKTLKDLKNIHVSAYEKDGEITFLHKIEPGSVDKSYGIHVAKLAGLPDNLIKRADEILKVYEDKEKNRDIKIQESLPLDDLIPKKSKVEEELSKINPLETTPMEALNILNKLCEMNKNQVKDMKKS